MATKAPETKAVAVPSRSLISTLTETIDISKVKQLNLPPIIKPADVSNPGVMISGTITKIVNSPVSTFKSFLIVMRHKTGQDFCFPMTAVVAKALATEIDLDLAAIKSPKPSDFAKLVGMQIAIAGAGSTKTKDGKRSVNLFQVYRLEQ